MADYSELKNEIINAIKDNGKILSSFQALDRMISDKSATYLTAADFSKMLGEQVSAVIGKAIPNGIPEDELADFAEQCLKPVYEKMQSSMLDVCEDVQRLQNQLANLNIAPVNVEPDASMIENAVEKFKEAENFKEVEFLTKKNTTQSMTRDVVSESIRQNAEFQEKAGLNVLFSRRDNGEICDFCKSVVGEFRSYEELPRGFWQVHKGCKCSIDYRVGKRRSSLSFKTNDEGKLEKITEEIRQERRDSASVDILDEYLKNAKPNKGEPKEGNSYTAPDGNTYTTGNKNVQLRTTEKEKKIAKLYLETFGGEVIYVPEVHGKIKNVPTPDYLINGERFDLKTLTGHGKDLFRDAIKRKLDQAENFIFDITETGLTNEEIREHVNNIFNGFNTKSVDKLFLIKDGKFIHVYKRA